LILGYSCGDKVIQTCKNDHERGKDAVWNNQPKYWGGGTFREGVQGEKKKMFEAFSDASGQTGLLHWKTWTGLSSMYKALVLMDFFSSFIPLINSKLKTKWSCSSTDLKVKYYQS